MKKLTKKLTTMSVDSFQLPFMLLVFFSMAFFVALPANAVCTLGNLNNPENDCDLDGYTILQGDCNDDGELCPANACDPVGGPYEYGCECGGRVGALTNPGAVEICDGKNNNCDFNNEIDEGLAVDGDNDGVLACGTCGAAAAPDCDCNDSRGDVHPGLSDVCDALDNDCDGTVDNQAGTGVVLERACYSGPAGTQNNAPCQGGTQLCNASTAGVESWGSCGGEVVPVHDPSLDESACNNIDDDCDGTVDDGLIFDDDNDGFLKCGTCGAGATCDCDDTRGDVNPSRPEVCDGVDHNCSGDFNDGVGVRRCFEGTNVTGETYSGTCPGPSCAPKGECVAGSQTCTAAGVWGSCGGGLVLPSQDPSLPEGSCDGNDEDCDGVIDDGLAIDADGDGWNACDAVCGLLPPNCDCNDSRDDVNPGESEQCDAVDHDCDGSFNNGIAARRCYDGPAASHSGTCPGPNCNPYGECSAGTQACLSSGSWAASCSGESLPAQDPTLAEALCNGLDEDCDNVVDDGFDSDNDGVGRCGACTAFLGASNCDCDDGNGENYPGNTEVCDSQDNNCNNLIDEGFDVDGDGWLDCNFCNNGNGNCDCDDSSDSVYPGAPELCDCIDQNCNGEPADGFADLDGDGVPSCAASECNDDPNSLGAQQHGAFCSIPARNESCDALDNDCDGFTDERNNNGQPLRRSCYTGPAGTVGIGECQGGREYCEQGMWGSCEGEVVPTNAPADAETLCDGLDNDCDNTPDDGFDQDNDGAVSCALCGLLPGCDCDDSNGEAYPGAVEICDNVDRDCDGNVNNVPARKCFSGSPFITADTFEGECPGPSCEPKGACVVGTQSCSIAGVWDECGGDLVLPAHDPAEDEQLCNSLDEDCDGVVDDGSFDVDDDGFTSCGGDCNDNDPLVNPDALEICDGIDNDCIGGADGVQTPCYGGRAETLDVGLCVAGNSACVEGQPEGECIGQIMPVEEVCDTFDNDCDGEIDEDFDLDQDGAPECALCPGLDSSLCDCDDSDPFNGPAGVEICDCQDNDCDGLIDEEGVCDGAPCHDFDGDGFSNCDGDCNDRDSLVGPHRPEVFGNGQDDDCDGAIDEDVDEDGDGVTTGEGDCDDRFATIFPGAEEKCDGFDNNCDGQVDEGFDQDGDYATVCAGDCDDNDPSRSPFRTEICDNNQDDDCDGLIDEDTDQDGDGVTTCQGDCNDLSATVYPAVGGNPAAAEVCDGQDNDCNGQTDEGFDLDGDRVATCFGDCDDENAEVNPAHIEVQGNNIDDNCNGVVDEGVLDLDGDGYSPNCGDCNDSDAQIYPHAEEVCDRIDNNCDSYFDALPNNAELCAVCFDADGDGLTNCDGDCNDRDPGVYPGADEVCDLVDNDCDGTVDLDAQGFTVCTALADAGILDAGATLDAGMLTVDAGTAAAPAPTEVAPDEDKKALSVGCTCSSSSESESMVGLLALLGLFLLRKKKKNAEQQLDGKKMRKKNNRANKILFWLLGLSFLLAATIGCETIIVPDSIFSDAGTYVDGGSLDAEDAGSEEPDLRPNPDAGIGDECNVNASEKIFIHTLPNNVQLTTVEGQVVEAIAAGNLVAVDEERAEIASFVYARPTGLTALDTAEIEDIAEREVIAALDALSGAPAIQSRIERTRRNVQPGPWAYGVTSSHTLSLLGGSTAWDLRRRLASAMVLDANAGANRLPQGPVNATQATSFRVDLLTWLGSGSVVVIASITPSARAIENGPRLGDLTNGTHIGPSFLTIQNVCERKILPDLKSDLLWVIDNSGSMQEEQQALANAAGALHAALGESGLDFRLGVITTDGEVLRGDGFTTELLSFQNAVQVGISGNGLEMGLEFALRGIRHAQSQSDPARQIREDAGLIVIVFSDEDNTGLMNVTDYVAEFQAEGAVLYAIVGPRPFGCQLVGLGVASPGFEYIEAAQLTGGSSGSICNPNLAETVQEILVGALGVATKSPLLGLPISGSLSVITDSKVERSRTQGFDYEPLSNTVLFFGDVPEGGTVFDVAYKRWGALGG